MEDPDLIVTAAVIEKEGKILIARRKPGGYQGNKWEFPGGKLEEGETPEECLKRELKEELGIEADVGEFVITSLFSVGCVHRIELWAYRAYHRSGEFTLNDHTEMAWVYPEDLCRYDFALPDVPIVKKLIRAD